MKRRDVWPVLIFSLFGFLFATQEKESRWNELLQHLAEKSQLEGEKLFYFKKLTPFLLDFIFADSQRQFPQKIESLQTVDELRKWCETIMGGDLIDFGEKMFHYFEEKAPPYSEANRRQFESEHFVFLTYAESPGDKDMPMIIDNSEKVYAAIQDIFGFREEVEKSLKTVLNKEINKEQKISVYIYPSRTPEANKHLKKTMGASSFGATIDEKGNGRLTARLNILYFNGFSLAILYHEIAHIVLLLGSFDITQLTAKTLQGESDLRNSFFAGYKKIPLFLQEGIGDYATYFCGFYSQWPLLPPFRELVLSVVSCPESIPLEILIQESALFILKNHKRYSLEAASFIRFLIEHYDKNKLKQWLLSGDKKPKENFERIFGLDLKTMEKKWQGNLKS